MVLGTSYIPPVKLFFGGNDFSQLGLPLIFGNTSKVLLLFLEYITFLGFTHFGLNDYRQ
jgi:hypothetical protein